MTDQAWLDISVIQCPHCGRYFVDASWYVVELESDIECGSCYKTFNTKKQLTDRLMLGFKIDKKGRASEARIVEHIQPKSEN